MVDPDESQIRLDLEKYGLGYLHQKPSQDWTSSEIESLLDAFAKENIAPTIEFPCVITFSKINELLHKSYCRRCGRCCLLNPVDPLHPGVEVFEDELKLIRRNFHISHRKLKKRTHVGRQWINPVRPSEIATTIFMTLPCMFYNSTKKQCQVYEARPRVCKIFPIKFREGASSLSIDVRCDYGRDIYRSLIAEIGED
jgi:Fe-S-cluster containining protein